MAELQDLDPESEALVESTQETPEPAEPAGDAAKPEAEPKIPYHVLQEERHNRHQAQQYAQQLQMQILAMQQQLNAQQPVNRDNSPAPDPDVENIVRPVLNKHVAPLVQQLQAAQNELARLQAKDEAQAAWNYVLQNVPDMNELRDDLMAELGKKSQVVRNKIMSDPDMVIELAEKVRMSRSGAPRPNKVQNDLRSRAWSESGGNATKPGNSQKIDWGSMTDAEFDKAYEKIQRSKRGY